MFQLLKSVVQLRTSLNLATKESNVACLPSDVFSLE